MAIEKNASTEEVVGAGVRLYTGISAMKVVAVNPTLKELHDLGLMFQKEPVYQVQFENNPGSTTKCVFWLENENTLVPLEILITPGIWKSGKNEKIKWLNKTGQDLWSEVLENGKPNPSNMKDWHKNPETFYPCPRGIDKLTEFVAAWANVATDGEVKLDTYTAISKGDMSELKSLIVGLKDNSVRVLVYVRDMKYQGVYLEHFGRVKPERDDLFTKKMVGDYGQVPGEFSMEWKEYAAKAPKPDSDTNDLPSGDLPNESDWLEGAEANGLPKDDLAF
jgi:hypothetical protein